MPILVFLFCFVLTMGVYTGLRLLFLVWNKAFYFQQPTSDLFLAFIHGLRFDLSAIAILSIIPFFSILLLALYYRKRPDPKILTLSALVFWIFQTPLIIVNYVDSEFVNFLGRRFTYDAIVFAKEGEDKAWQILAYYWKLGGFNLVCYLLSSYLILVWAPKKIRRWNPEISFRNFGIGVLTTFVLLSVSARGGLQSKPINFAHSQIFLNPSMNNLVLNSSFTFIQTVSREPLKREKFFSDEEMLKWMRTGISGPSLLEGKRPAVKPNIVLIILESFALEYTGKGGYTPFLDELSAKSISFTNAFANARRSIEGMGAIIGGVPALMNEPFISSQYMTNTFQGLGNDLQSLGYDTSFFHGAKNGSMYFDQFMQSAGVKKYFGMNEYPNSSETDGTWGIWDEPFLQWMNSQISSFPQPFFSTVFTLTSHNPFAIPAQYAGKFPKGSVDIHESIGYTDYSLRKFFEAAEKQPWFKNTIFIVTADHTYKVGRPEFDNELGHYRVPLLIYSPNIPLPKLDTAQVVQHIDLMPSILDLVGYQEHQTNLLGRSVFVPGDRTAISFIDNRYLFIAKDFFLQFHPVDEPKMYSMKDANQTKPLVEPADRKNELVNRMKAQIQYFSQGLWDNKLYYPTGQQ